MTNNPKQLREAAALLVKAAEFLEHNEAIFKGKWKKGSKAWGGDFIERTVAEALALISTTGKRAAGSAARPHAEGNAHREQVPSTSGPIVCSFGDELAGKAPPTFGPAAEDK